MEWSNYAPILIQGLSLSILPLLNSYKYHSLSLKKEVVVQETKYVTQRFFLNLVPWFYN